MAARKLINFANENDMLSKGNFVYGIYNGYHISMQQITIQYSAMTDIHFTLTNMQDSDKEKLKSFIKENKKTLMSYHAQYKNGQVVMRTSASAGHRKRRLVDVLNAFTEFFKDNSIVSGCSETQQKDKLQFVYYKGYMKVIAQVDMPKYEELSEKMAVENEDRGYLLGIIGASVGGIIGMIPWVAFAMIGYVSSISGLVMGLLVKQGYKTAKGKRGGAQLAILIIALVVFTYLGIMAAETYFGVQYLMSEGIAFADIELFELFKFVVVYPFTPDAGTSEIWGSIMQGYLFAGLGSAFFFAKAKSNNEFSAGEQIDVNVQQPVMYGSNL